MNSTSSAFRLDDWSSLPGTFLPPPARPIADDFQEKPPSRPPFELPDTGYLDRAPCSFCGAPPPNTRLQRGSVGVCGGCAEHCRESMTIDTQAPDGRIFADLDGILH